jgi:hypothetical protein
MQPSILDRRLQTHSQPRRPQPLSLTEKQKDKLLYLHRRRTQKQQEVAKKHPQNLKRDLRIQGITANRFNLKPGDEWTPEALEVLRSKLPHLFRSPIVGG